MPTPGTYYTGRLPLPDFIQRGSDTDLSLTVYRDGAKVTMDAATATVYDESGGTLATLTGTIASNTATVTVTGASTATQSLGDGWRVEWAVTLNGSESETFRNDAALVRTILRPVITDEDLYRRVSGLDSTGSNALASKSDYQDFIDEAWVEISQRLIEQGNRPNLVGSPSSLRGCHLYLTLALVFEDMAARAPEAFSDRAEQYRRHYEAAWKRVTFRYPEDEYGNTPNRRRSAVGTMFLCVQPRRGLY